MKSAKLYRYRLPMDSGVILRDNKLVERVGYIVELHRDGDVGRGEIAPLPGFSLEHLDQAGAQAQEMAQLWVRGDDLDLESMFPSVAFGLSMAMLELEQGLPLDGNHRSAPLCYGDADDLIPVLSTLSGECVAKLKVGLYEPIRDGMLVNVLLEAVPNLMLRLDANRAWTLEKAQKFASYIAPSRRQRIAFIEEPCKHPGDSLSFAINTGIAIAWDETLQEGVRDEEFSLEDLTGVKTIVIKPTLIGSILRCITLIKRSRDLGIQPIISSSLESSLGLNQLARLSRWLLPNVTPGLDTMQLFKAQLEVPWPNSDLPLERLEQQELVWQS